MEYDLTRRDFITNSGLALIAYSLTDRVFADENEKDKQQKEQENRLKKLEYLFNPPKKEYYGRYKKRELTLDKDNFSLLVPKKTPIKESELFKIVSYDEKKEPYLLNFWGNETKPAIDEFPQIGLYLVSRDYLKSEEVKNKLRKAVKENKLPFMCPSWRYESDDQSIQLIPTGEVKIKIKSADKINLALPFAKKYGLRQLKSVGNDHITFQLLMESEFVSAFDVARAFIKENKEDVEGVAIDGVLIVRENKK